MFIDIDYSLFYEKNYQQHSPSVTDTVAGSYFRPTDTRMSTSISITPPYRNSPSSTVHHGGLSGESFKEGILSQSINPFADDLYLDITLSSWVRGGFTASKNRGSTVSYTAYADPIINIESQYSEYFSTEMVLLSGSERTQIGTSPTSVPEPTTLTIFALGLMGLASRRFKKKL